MTQELEFKHCCGCYKPAAKCRCLMALPNRIYICESCFLIMASIFTHQAKADARIYIVDELARIMEEPLKTVAQWKEIRTEEPQPPAQGKEG